MLRAVAVLAVKIFLQLMAWSRCRVNKNQLTLMAVPVAPSFSGAVDKAFVSVLTTQGAGMTRVNGFLHHSYIGQWVPFPVTARDLFPAVLFAILLLAGD